MRILALDMSLNTCGVCRLVNVCAGHPVWEVETITMPPLRVPGARAGTEKNAPRTGAARLAWWRGWLMAETRKPYPPLVIAEAPALRGSGMVADIGELSGVLKLACLDYTGHELKTVGIQQIKKFATGLGNADKQRMIDTAAESLGGESALDEHQADAYWLAEIAFLTWGGGETNVPYRALLAKKLADKAERGVA